PSPTPTPSGTATPTPTPTPTPTLPPFQVQLQPQPATMSAMPVPLVAVSGGPAPGTVTLQQLDADGSAISGGSAVTGSVLVGQTTVAVVTSALPPVPLAASVRRCVPGATLQLACTAALTSVGTGSSIAAAAGVLPAQPMDATCPQAALGGTPAPLPLALSVF